MSLPAPSKLYFAGALLFLCAATIEISVSGLERKTLFGLAMAGSLVALGLRQGQRRLFKPRGKRQP